jgi:hypothetical protein
MADGVVDFQADQLSRTPDGKSAIMIAELMANFLDWGKMSPKPLR